MDPKTLVDPLQPLVTRAEPSQELISPFDINQTVGAPSVNYASPLIEDPVAALAGRKMREIEQRSLEKRARLAGVTPEEILEQDFQRDLGQLSRADMRLRYGERGDLAAAARDEQELAKILRRLQGRTTGEVITDTGVNVLEGGVQLVGGAASLLEAGDRRFGFSAGVGRMLDLAGPEGAGDAFRRERALAGEGWSSGVRDTLGSLNSMTSTTLQARREMAAEEAALDAAASRRQAEIDREVGMPGWLADAKRVGTDFVDSAGQVLEDPVLLGAFTAQQVPTLGIGLGAKALVTTEQVAARTALLAEQQAVRNAMVAPSAASTLSRAQLQREAAEQLAARNLMVGTGASEGAGAYQGAAGEILGMSNEELAQEFPDYAAALLNPETADQARMDLADSVGLRTAAIQAPLAGLTSRVAARFETNPLGSGLDAAETAARQRVAAGVGNIAREGLEETIQSGGGALAANVGNMSAGREDVDLLEGVGAAAGQGLAGGLGMAGVLQSPAMVGNTAGIGVDAVKGMAGTAWNALQERGAAIRNQIATPARQQAAEAFAAREEAAQAVVTQAADLGVDLGQDDAITETVRTQLNAEGLSKVETLNRVLEATRAETDPDKLNQYRFFAVKTSRELLDARSQVTDRLENETDPEARERLESLVGAIDTLSSDPIIQEMEEGLRAIPQEQISALNTFMANLPDNIDTGDVQANPEVLKTLDYIREMSYVAPSKLTPEGAKKAKLLFQKTGRGSKKDIAQLELALNVTQAEQTFNEVNEKIQQKYPRVKTADQVSQNILETGFELGGFRMPSLREHMDRVNAAMAAGNTKVAERAMGKLLDFVVKIQDRAEAFDKTANAAIDSGNLDSPLDVQSRTLDESGLSQNLYKLTLSNENSRATIDRVFADSNLVASYYNALANRYPELGFTADANEAQAATWQARITPDQLSAPKARSVAGRKENANGVRSAGTPVAVPGSAPADAAATAEDTSTDVAEPAARSEDNVPSQVAEDQAEVAEEAAAPQEAPEPVTEPQKPAVKLKMKQTPMPDGPGVTKRTAITKGGRFTLTDRLAPSGTDFSEFGEVRIVEAFDGDARVGELIYANDGTPPTIEVDEAYQRRNIATAMLKLAKQQGGVLGDAKGGIRGRASEYRTPAGQAFRSNANEDAVQLLEYQPEPVVETAPVTEVVEEAVPETAVTEEAVAEETAPVEEAQPVEAEKPTMASRFRTLKDLAGDSLADKNQWLNAFKLAQGEVSLLVSGGLKALQERIQQPFQNLVDLETQAMGVLVNDLIPDIISSLNERLAEVVAKDKRLLGNDNTLWNFNDKLSLHATNYGQGADKLEYDPAVAEGVASAATIWLMETMNREYPADRKYVADFLGSDAEFVTTEELRIFQQGMVQKAMIGDLASRIPSLMGLVPNNEAPGSSVDGLPKALAADVMSVFIKYGIVRRTEYALVERLQNNPGAGVRVVSKAEGLAAKKRGEKFTPFYVLSYNRDPGTLLVDVRKDLGLTGLRELQRLMAPEAVQDWQMGEPPAQKERNIRGSAQELSPTQRRILKSQNAVKFYRNTRFINWLNKLGEENALKLFGFTPFVEEITNKMDAVRLNGINEGLKRSWNALQEWNVVLEREAAARGVAPEELATFFPHYLTSNNRVMMDGAVNPQSNKLMREAVVSTRSVMEIGNEQHEVALRLAVAQALGMKVENAKTHQSLVDAVDKRMNEGGDLYEVWTALAADDEDFTANQLFDRMLDAGFEPGGAAVKAFHALHAWLAYDMAKTQGEKTVEIFLAFEQDGKTDGPANAMAQLGLGELTETMVENLARAGYYVNSQAKALGDTASELGDLYGAVAQGAQEKFRTTIRDLAGQFRSGSRNEREFAEVVGTGLASAVRLFARLKKVKGISEGSEDGREILDATFERSFAKHAVTASAYSGGARAIAAEMAQSIQELLYTELSRGLADETEIDQQLGQSINALITHRIFVNEEGDRVVEQINGPINFADISKYRKFEFTSSQTEAMLSHLSLGLAEMLGEAIEDQMSGTVAGMRALVRLAQVQNLVFKRQYDKAYKEEHARAVAAGEILPTQSLSPKVEQKILADLRILAPIFQFSTTADVGDRTVGLNMSVTDRAAVAADVNGKAISVSSLGGGLAVNVNKLGFTDPGVRAAALTIISAGDATMMANYFGGKERAALNVWDGLEVGIADLFTAGQEINEAVFKAWRYDLVGGVSKQFSESVPAIVDAVRADEKLALVVFKALGGKLEKGKPLTMEKVEAALRGKARFWEQYARRLEVTKQVFLEMGMSIDHMAGARRPYVVEGTQVPMDQFPAEAALRVEARMAELAEQEKQAESSKKEEQPVLVPVTEAKEHRGDAAIAAVDARVAAEGTPIQKFIWKQIRGLLSKDLVVHQGTPSQMLRKIAEVFPGVDLPTEMQAGAYLDNQVFLANDSLETLLHELIHAGVASLVDRAYQGGKGLTAHQKQSVKELETLAKAFLTQPVEGLDGELADALETAQAAVRDLLNEGDAASAVNEFLAWTLSNPLLAERLQQAEPPSGLKALSGRVMAVIRRIFGLPANAPVNSFLDQSLGQFYRLTRPQRTLAAPSFGRVLFQRLSQGANQTGHQAHLASVVQELQTILDAVPPHVTVTREDRAAANRLANQQLTRFLNAGFQLSREEEAVFELTQTVLALGIPLDPRVMTVFQGLQESAAKTLTVEDFMDDPNSSDPAMRAAAQDQYLALFGADAQAFDAKGRSTQLANFVALALSQERFRQKLSNLDMPKAQPGPATANGQLRAWSTRIFDRLSNASLGLSPNTNQRAAVDALMTRLSAIQSKWARMDRASGNAFETAEQRLREGMAKVAMKSETLLQAREEQGKSGGIHGYINLLLRSVQAMGDEDAAGTMGEAILATTSRLPKELRELFAEMVGGTEVSRPIHTLLNQARSKVAQIRQRLREEAPQHIRALFSKELSEQTWARLVRSVGKTDLQSLLGSYSGDQIQALLNDRVALDAEMQRLENLISNRDLVDSVDTLASYMMTGYQLPGKGVLYRNANAIAQQPGFGRDRKITDKRLVKNLDHLITLRALTYLSKEETNELVDLFRDERAGVEGTLRVLRQRVTAERSKDKAYSQAFNEWKGYIPVSMDPRHEVRLANAKEGEELLLRGWERVGRYNDALSYYAMRGAGGRLTYNQGALQTVEGSVMGVDYLTGRTLGQQTQKPVTYEPIVAQVVKDLTGKKWRTQDRLLLIPVFNADGEVIAFERPLDRDLLDRYTNSKPDLAQSIGMWMGRQAEEELATEFNDQVVQVLHKIWEDAIAQDKTDDFVNVADPSASVTMQDTWNTIPRETQKALKRQFRGPVMVRKDMLNNALGYRSASVGDAFVGMSELPKTAQDALINVSVGLMGKNAYRYMTMIERSWQGVIGAAKDVIVVRSGVVALANGLSNQFQLMMHGIPLKRLVQIQAGKASETETYLRNAHRIARIQVELDSITNPGKRRVLELERQGLHDLNRRLSIWPLIEAGELPTIAEGLTEQDEYTLLGDAMGWIERKAESLPPGLLTVGKYAVVAKDTALYQGLNRMVQFGDFMAKAALYDHLVQNRGMTQQEALAIVSERFVNYNLLAGRTRDYLESMGFTWFMNYKLRVQKVVLSTLRENPLRFLMAGAGAEWLGSDSLVSSSAPAANWEASLGMGQLWRSSDAIMWNQMIN